MDTNKVLIEFGIKDGKYDMEVKNQGTVATEAVNNNQRNANLNSDTLLKTDDMGVIRVYLLELIKKHIEGLGEKKNDIKDIIAKYNKNKNDDNNNDNQKYIALRAQYLKYINDLINYLFKINKDTLLVTDEQLKKFYKNYILDNISIIRKLFKDVNKLLKEFNIKLTYEDPINYRKVEIYKSFIFKIQYINNFSLSDIDLINILIDNGKIVAKSFTFQSTSSGTTVAADKKIKDAETKFANINQEYEKAKEEYKEASTHNQRRTTQLNKSKLYQELMTAKEEYKNARENNKIKKKGGKSNKTKKKRSSFKNNLNSI